MGPLFFCLHQRPSALPPAPSSASSVPFCCPIRSSYCYTAAKPASTPPTRRCAPAASKQRARTLHRDIGTAQRSRHQACSQRSSAATWPSTRRRLSHPQQQQPRAQARASRLPSPLDSGTRPASSPDGALRGRGRVMR
jgi:hypothetical protein